MKRLFLPILAAMLMMLTAVSCTKDNLLEPSDQTIAGKWLLTNDNFTDVKYQNTEYTFGSDHTLTITHTWTQDRWDTIIMSYEFGAIEDNIITLKSGSSNAYEENWCVRITQDNMEWMTYNPNPDIVGFGCLGFVRVK